MLLAMNGCNGVFIFYESENLAVRNSLAAESSSVSFSLFEMTVESFSILALFSLLSFRISWLGLESDC